MDMDSLVGYVTRIRRLNEQPYLSCSGDYITRSASFTALLDPLLSQIILLPILSCQHASCHLRLHYPHLKKQRSKY